MVLVSFDLVSVRASVATSNGKTENGDYYLTVSDDFRSWSSLSGVSQPKNDPSSRVLLQISNWNRRATSGTR